MTQKRKLFANHQIQKILVVLATLLPIENIRCGMLWHKEKLVRVRKNMSTFCESLSISLESSGIAIKNYLQLNQVLKTMSQPHDSGNNKYFFNSKINSKIRLKANVFQ